MNHFLFLFIFFIATTQGIFIDIEKCPTNNFSMHSKQHYYNLLVQSLSNDLDLKVTTESWPGAKPGIYYVFIHCDYYKDINSIEEARRLVLSASELILDYLNDNESGIKKHTTYDPFPPEKLHLEIEFTKNLNDDKPLIYVSFYRGQIKYLYEYDRIKVPDESFEEAKAKVASYKDAKPS